jgi:hypothetical protein
MGIKPFLFFSLDYFLLACILLVNVILSVCGLSILTPWVLRFSEFFFLSSHFSLFSDIVALYPIDSPR